MLKPSYLEQLPEPVVDLVSELENEIIADITARVVKGNYNTPSTEWLTYKANQFRLSSQAVNRIIAKKSGETQKVVRGLYTEAVKAAIEEDVQVYEYAVKDGIISDSGKLHTYFRSVAFNNIFRKGLQNTNTLMKNLTNSMAKAAGTSLIHAMDLAWLETASGAYTPDEAIYKAVKNLYDKGLTVVHYQSGHKDQADVAVRRAVRTSINKTCCDMQLDLANEMGCDLVEVTSHFGARPTHAEWQGQVYSLSGKNPKYKPFSVTGYGTGDGLGGWNCRHSFHPYFEGLSERASKPSFTKEENEEYYKLTQKQRALERAIRKTKRDLTVTDSARQNAETEEQKAAFNKDYARQSAVLKRQEQRLDSFVKANGLAKDNSRVRVAGFGKSISQKAVHAAKNYQSGQHNIKGSSSFKFNKIIGEKPISKAFKQELINEYNNFTKVFGNIDTLTAVEATAYLNDGVYGGYNDNSGIIELCGAGGDNGKQFMQTTATEMKKQGKWSTASPFHQYRHELAHGLQKFNRKNDPNYQKKIDKIKKIKENIWIDLTSKAERGIIDLDKEQGKILSVYGLQAGSDIDELISESIAEYLNGKPRETAKNIVNIILGKD